jgi:Viral BACON domain
MMRSTLKYLVPFALLCVMVACGDKSDPAPPGTPSPSPVPSPGPSPSPSCTATVAGVPATVSAKGGNFAFSLSAAANCAWTARTDVTWADVSPASGQGSASPLLRVSEQTRVDARTLMLTVNTQTFRITQESTGCNSTLDYGSLDVADEGGQLSIAVNVSAGCAWTVALSESWITTTTPNGTGSGFVNLQIARNTGDARRAFVTIAGVQITVTQRRG